MGLRVSKLLLFRKRCEMYRYYVSNYDHNFLKRINEIEFKDFKIYKEDLEKFSNIFDCYQNYKRSEITVRNYIENIDKYGTCNLNEVYRNCKYIFMQNIIFGRILIDNVKSYCNQLNRLELKKKVRKFESLDELRMLKLLRDFGQHFSLPFSDLKMKTCLSDETTTIEPLISVGELRRNEHSNKQNKMFLKTITDKEVSILNYFRKWSIKLDELYIFIKQDFSLFTSSKMNRFIKNNIACFDGNTNGYIPIGLSQAELIDQTNGLYRTIEFISFDEMVLFDLFS